MQEAKLTRGNGMLWCEGGHMAPEGQMKVFDPTTYTHELLKRCKNCQMSRSNSMAVRAARRVNG